RPSIVVRHPDGDVALLTAGAIHPTEKTGIAPAVRDVGIARIHGDRRVLTAGHRVVVALTDRAIIRSARDRDRGVVLLRAIDAVRPLVVRGHVVELRRRLVVNARPGFAAVE